MFKLPQNIKDGIRDYKNSLEDLLSGKTSPARFTGVRVPWGIYSHRGGKIFMNRIRIPAGVITSDQLKAIATVAKKYGNGVAHITTRQDIQLHEVKIEDTIKVMEFLKEYELSPRGGGGNTVRNITSCALSGLCRDEILETKGYAVSLTEFLLGQDSSYNLPRKFKIGFSGCAKDCAAVCVNDVGLLAKEKYGERGFEVFVGGGMGLESMTAQLLEEFIPEEDLGWTVQAVKNVFYKKGDRRNRHHNRLRFLIKDMGFENFKSLYLDELKLLKESEYIVLRKPDARLPSTTPEGEIARKDDLGYKEFLKYNLFEQRQNGLVSVELRIPRGDITAQSLESLSSLSKDFDGIEFRTSQNQNIFICNIRKEALYKLFSRLKKILKDFLYPETLLDIVSCKGALTCNLGLCNSPGLTEELEKVIEENFIGTAVFNNLNIKINGCPNSCGQHPLGMIALHGAVRKVQGRAVPFYKLLLGGRKAGRDTSLAKDTGILIPARNVPSFIKDFLSKVERQIDEKIAVSTFIDEKGKDLAKKAAEAYSYVPSYSKDKNFYIDWGKKEEFSLEGLGPGECGAGVIDMIEADLTDARNYLEKQERDGYPVQDIRKAIFHSARALLVVKGSDPKDEETTLNEFLEKFVKEGIADPKFSNLKENYDTLKEDLILEARRARYLYAKEFFGHIKELYKNMEPSFNFPKNFAPQGKGKLKEAKPEGIVLDLKGTPCPINYVKAKLFFENLNTGDIVTIYLDEGEPIDNVPKSLQNDGHEIISIEKQDGFYKVTVKKG